MTRRVKKKHETEENYPEQCAEFQKILSGLYKLHLDKNREYSPNNIKAIGVLGCSLRIFEKTIRLLNLLGWDVWEGKPKESLEKVKFGGAEEELADIANLAVIASILKRSKWAK